MTFQALLVTQDEEAAAVLTQVLSGFGLGVQSCRHAEAAERLAVQQFSAVVVDFDDPQSAFHILQSGAAQVSAAVLADRTRVRTAFGAGANFVVYKPVMALQAEATLRAAVALLKRERRRSARVPLQVPVWLRIQNGPEIEGILLDVSETGMEVLSSRALCPSASIGFRFSVPNTVDVEGRGEVAWAQPNGQSGVRFADIAEQTNAKLKEWVASNARSLPSDEPQPGWQCKLTDLSLGGCYVETDSPFPERAAVSLSLKAGEMNVEVQGMVRVMHPSLGMGVEFASSTEEQRQQVRTFIEALASQRGVVPELRVAPASLPLAEQNLAPQASNEDDPLLELLRHHESLSTEEFLGELRKQRSAAAGA